MELITMNCAQNKKVIIYLNELRNNERLEGACVFKRLFNIGDKDFKAEKVNTELFNMYNIYEQDWYAFLNFIRNGRIEYDMSSQYIEKEEERDSYQKLFIQTLDSQSNSGIFLKFGPFPVFDNYIKESTQRSLNNMINKKTQIANNPMTPNQDKLLLYKWKTGHFNSDENWIVTIPVPGSVNRGSYWRRLKKSIN